MAACFERRRCRTAPARPAMPLSTTRYSLCFSLNQVLLPDELISFINYVSNFQIPIATHRSVRSQRFQSSISTNSAEFPCIAAAFVNPEPHTGARSSVRVCVGLMTALLLKRFNVGCSFAYMNFPSNPSPSLQYPGAKSDLNLFSTSAFGSLGPQTFLT